MSTGHRARSVVWRDWLGLAAALYLLNLGLSFHNVWPTLMVENRHELSIETALLLLALVLYAELRRPPARRLLGWLALLFTVLVVGRYAEVTAPALFGRAINLYWDAQYLPAVMAMLSRVAPAWLVALVVLGVVLLLVLVYSLLRVALARVWSALDRPAPRRTLGVLAALLVAVYYAPYFGLPGRPTGWYSLPVSATYVEQARFLVRALADDAQAGELPATPLVASDLALARGTDVFVIFVESYGAITYDRPELAAVVDPERMRLADAVAASGRSVVSAFVRAPTFGGGSWLSHLSLLSGVEVRDQGSYATLMTQRRQTLVQRFEASGHRGLALMPGLRNAWPEGAFYGFEQIYDADTLDYRGPEFAWWRIPDQFALARLDEVELTATERQPRFVFFPTISSHMPFRPLPPYQPDWARMLNPQPYDAAIADAALAVEPEWTRLGPAYAESIAYAHQWLAGWITERRGRPMVALVLGDHQPPAAVSGRDAAWEVPVHVFCDDPRVAAALVAAGFTAGLTPRRPALGGMHELYPLLLRVLDSSTANTTPPAT